MQAIASCSRWLLQLCVEVLIALKAILEETWNGNGIPLQLRTSTTSNLISGLDRFSLAHCRLMISSCVIVIAGIDLVVWMLTTTWAHGLNGVRRIFAEAGRQWDEIATRTLDISTY